MLRDPKAPGKEAVYTVVTRGPKLGKAIRTERWRYALWPDGEELYDLENDAKEHRNLAKSRKHATTMTAMRAHLTKAESHAAQARRQTQ